MGKKGGKKRKIPVLEPIDSVLSRLHDSSSISLVPHSISLDQDNIFCIWTVFEDYKPTGDIVNWAQTLNSVNSKGIGSFFIISEGRLGLRTASMCSSDAEEREAQVKRIVDTHNENMKQYLSVFDSVRGR